MPRYVIILSTAINTPTDLRHVFQSVNFFSGIFEWSVDLDDCDKILRIVCGNNISLELVKILKSGGVNSLVLEIFDENGISII